VGVFEVANPATLWQSWPVKARALPIPEPCPVHAAATPIAFARTIVRPTGVPGGTHPARCNWHRFRQRCCIEANGRMTARQMELLSGAAMQELDDEGLGAFSPPPALGQLRHAGARLAQRARTWAWRSSAGAATTAC
jgi:hypothetical protein